jgi:hypothetical protein
MSEPLQTEQPIVETRPRAHVAVVGAGEDLEVQFKDCRRVLPASTVATLGGAERVKAMGETFANYRYQDFITSFNRSQERKALNRIGANFVRAALANVRGGF